MTRIGGGSGIPPKPTDTQPVGPDVAAQKGAEQAKGAGAKNVDSYQRAGNIEAKLSALGGPQLAQKLNFTSADLAVLAQQFANIVRQNPNADRAKRAKLFAKAILKKKGAPVRGKLAKLLDEENEEL